MKQGDWVYAWNYKQPDKKVKTRFLHKLEGVRPSNICTSPDTTDTYPKKVNLRRYDMVVPDNSTVNVPDSLYNNMKTKPTLPSAHSVLIFLLICSVGLIILFQNKSLSNTEELTTKYYDMQDRVSRIEIKGDDTANQLMLSIENQYWQEIQTAVDIAYNAGYPHRKVVLINPSMNIVRLSDTDYSEISVNIVSKVITTYSPN